MRNKRKRTMKNSDKYQTMKERIKAFETFCCKRNGIYFWCPYLFNNWLNEKARRGE